MKTAKRILVIGSLGTLTLLAIPLAGIGAAAKAYGKSLADDFSQLRVCIKEAWKD